jgi:carboxypeptidase C (cathepsin A)
MTPLADVTNLSRRGWMRTLFSGIALAALLCVKAHSQAAAGATPVGRCNDSAGVAHNCTTGAADLSSLPPLPADITIEQAVRTQHGSLQYSVTIGTLAVRDPEGREIGQVVYHAYLLSKGGRNRPVTFAFNGGPGAASVFLNLGAIGPKHLAFGSQSDTPSSPVNLSDNSYTWLDFTDLVFVDPIGTGFSRSLLGKSESRKYFYGVEPDIEYLSRVVYDWLVVNKRLTSRKYLVGESYGGFRVPRLAHELQTHDGVGVSGIVMISPYLSGVFDTDDDLSPMGWVERLPSMAAARLEREGRLSTEAMAPVEIYAKGEFLQDLIDGPQDLAATGRIVSHVTRLLGVSPELAERMGGRIDTQTFLRELYRREGRIGSRYDVNVTSYDPFPWSYRAREGGRGDPILDRIIALATSAMVDYDTRIVGWKIDAPYHALNHEVGRLWRSEMPPDSVTDLRQAMAVDPELKVSIVHGYSDLSAPFFGSRLIIDQLPRSLDLKRIALHVYPGGHMFYTRSKSRAELYLDTKVMYSSR